MPTRRTSFLSLPLEVRQHIYALLLPYSPTSHPLPNVGLTAVSHSPPASALLNVTPQISDEILEYWYSITAWKIIFTSHANLNRWDHDFKGLERSASLRRLRRIEFLFFSCDARMLQSPRTSDSSSASQAIGTDHAHIAKRVHRACEVLVHADKLREVTLSWLNDTYTNSNASHDSWFRDNPIFTPLRKLQQAPRSVTFHLGDHLGLPEEWFREAVEVVLGPSSLKPRQRLVDFDQTKSAPPLGKSRRLILDTRNDSSSSHACPVRYVER